MAFMVDLENGLEQRKEKFQPTLSGELQNSRLNRFHILSSFLREKPYAFSLAANKSREIQNREFFERQTLNRTSYGGNFGLRNDLIPVQFSFNNSTNTIDRASRPSQDFEDDQLNLSLSNKSAVAGTTYFSFMQDQFHRSESGIPDQRGTSRDFSLNNHKPLSPDNDKTLSSFLKYYDLTGTRDSRFFDLNERLDIRHDEFLNSSYAYKYSDNSSSGDHTRNNQLNFDLRHRLYESLQSALNVHYFNSDGTNASQNVYGLSLNEDYTKKLGKIGRLTTGIGFGYDEEERKTPGNINSIIDEPHTLTIGDITLLDRPDVDITFVVVTDTTRTITYTVNIDYQLTTVGSRLQIQRIPGGAIANGQQVLVDYRASASPSFTFNTLQENYRFRFDFLDNLFGVYYRLTRENHPRISGQENTVLQTLTDDVYGVEMSYKTLKLGWERENFDSNLSPYIKEGFRESLILNPTPQWTDIFQSSQSQIRLINAQETQRFFDIINRSTYTINPTTRLNIEAGYRWLRGSNIELDDLTGKFGIEYSLGEFLMSAEYNYEKQLYLRDSLINHFFFTRVRREF